MRRLLLAACLVAGVAIANDDPFLKGEALKADISRKCAEGCVAFTREDAATFRADFEEIVKRARTEAFQAGMAAQKQACRSLI
jgi:hypothetical protein